MTIDRALSEWQADLKRYAKWEASRLRWMQESAANLLHAKSRKRRREIRSFIRKMYRQYADYRSRVRLCESAISFHEAMLNTLKT
jgi:hypothetical protein